MRAASLMTLPADRVRMGLGLVFFIRRAPGRVFSRRQTPAERESLTSTTRCDRLGGAYVTH
jgi:hypothetical protein